MLRPFAAIAFLLVTAANAQFKPSMTYDGVAFDALAGGLRRGTTYLGALRLQLALDRPNGTSALLQVLNKHGGSPSDFAGDTQGVSNLAAPNQWRVEEAWLQQNFLSAQLSILAGRYDLNSEFYRLQSAGLFLNSSFGIGPELSERSPSIYPITSTGIRVTYRPDTSLVVRAAAFNGLTIAEAAYLSRASSRQMPRDIRSRLGRFAALPPYEAKLSVGAWHSGQSSGLYFLGDQAVYKNGARRLAVFGQLGIGDARTEQFSRYIGTGIVLTAPFAGRDEDELGFAVAAAHKSGPGETALESTYLIPINGHIAIQPDVQYVVHPSADRSRRNALVMMLHFEVSP